MNLLIPYVDDLLKSDARLLHLAEFFGIRCEKLNLPRHIHQHAEYFEEAISNRASCLVVNPKVMKEWIGADSLPLDLVSVFLSRFPYLIVHGLHPCSIDADVISALSRGTIQSVQEVGNENSTYEISKSCEDVCGTFSGLSFGPVNRGNDRVFCVREDHSTIQELISIDGKPFMVRMKEVGIEILFLASADVVEVNEGANGSLLNYFSKLVPHAMALRHFFSDECWRPFQQQHASIIIDDPLLKRQYGFLNYESLLRVLKQYDFHVAIAFIPHNFRRSSEDVIQLFRQNPRHLSLCIHGNDHTGAEFASTDKRFLNTILRIADDRMNEHYQMSGLTSDKVMVFPQGHFSVEAMTALQANNFHAAVNSSPYPMQQEVHLTISELIQPAIVRYGGFPLFIRNSIEEMQKHNIALKLFFGQPVLICAHHDIGQRLDSLAELASRIHSVAPKIQWSNLATALSKSMLRRRAADGTFHVRAYSGSAQVSNESGSFERFIIEWNRSGERIPVDEVLRDGVPCDSFKLEEDKILLSVELPPGSSQTLSTVHRNIQSTQKRLGFSLNAKAFIRRRLSEFRDNYLSSHPYLLAMAKNIQRRVFSAKTYASESLQ
jgi:hypothetical protein